MELKKWNIREGVKERGYELDYKKLNVRKEIYKNIINE